MSLFCKFLYVVLPILASVNGANILMTEVFEIVIDPPMFNWTYEGHSDQFIYLPSLINKPDLPSWMSYVYSERYHSGFLYGVPPYDMDRDVTIEIIALNRKNYETRRNVIPIKIGEKLNPAKNEVQIKIDNLNVEDMFDADRMDRLKDVFRKQLWTDSQNDLYVTDLASAVQRGARMPLDPSEGEGVVIRIGSVAPLSQDLVDLQKEVAPLQRMGGNCPRNFKRTKVERYFREAGFALDWCNFKLLEENSSNGELDKGTVEKLSKLGSSTDQWTSIKKDKVPERSYTYEIIFSTFVPLVIMTLMAAILSLILCVQHNDFEDECSEIYFQNLFHICTDRWSESPMTKEEDLSQYSVMNPTTDSLKSYINNKDYMYFSPESVGTSRSQTGSPTLKGRGVHCRPSPPPYIKPTFKPDL